MEESAISNQGSMQEMHPQLTPVSVQYLLTAARWGKFLAILGFITILFMILAGLLLTVVIGFMGDKINEMGGLPSYFSYSWIPAFYVIIAIVYAVPVWLLNSFSNNVSKAVRNNDTPTMSTALKRLKNLFVFVGIFTILFLALYIIILIVVASAALLTA